MLLVGITPNPPVTFRDWLQILAGAALTAAMTTAAVRDWVRRSASRALGSGPARRLRDWRLWAWVLARALVAVVVAVTVPRLVDVARGLSYRRPRLPAVQLRVLAEPETVATTRELAGRYERWTADGNHGCPTAQAYVFAAEPATIADKVATTDGWSDATRLAARGRPAARRVAGVHPPRGRRGDHRGGRRGGVAARRALAPGARGTGRCAATDRHLAPGVPAARAGARCRVRSDPRTTQVGRLATVLLYGRDTAYPDAARSVAVEQSLDAARGTLPIGGAAADLLFCAGHRRHGHRRRDRRRRHRAGRRTLNQGAALGATCGPTPGRPGQDQRIEAVYPDDTADQDLQLVRLRCTDPVPVQERAAEAFGRWLRSDAGRSAVVATGLRPTGALPNPAAPLTGDYGVDPAMATSPEPVSAEPVDGRLRRARGGPAAQPVCSSSSTRPARWAGRCRAAPRRHRAAPVPPSRPTPWAPDWRACSRATSSGSRLFPGGTPDAYIEAVPVGLRDEGLATARDALARAQPGGGTPLFRAVTDGVTALSAGDQAPSGERIGTRALVVLTDGRDSASGTALNDVRDRVKGRGVRIVVVALGGVRCAEAGLATLADETGGECVESDPSDVPGRVQEFVTQLRGGQS